MRKQPSCTFHRDNYRNKNRVNTSTRRSRFLKYQRGNLLRYLKLWRFINPGAFCAAIPNNLIIYFSGLSNLNRETAQPWHFTFPSANLSKIQVVLVFKISEGNFFTNIRFVEVNIILVTRIPSGGIHPPIYVKYVDS